MNILFVIHTAKDQFTAVYSNYMQRAAYFEKHGHGTRLMTPNDFPWLKRISSRWYPLCYPLLVAFWLMKHGRNYDVVILHSYSGWAVNILRRVLPQFKRFRTVTMFHGLEPLYFSALQEEMENTGQTMSLRYRLMQGVINAQLIRQSCRRSDMVGCLNRQEAAYLIVNRWTQPAKVVILPNGVDNAFFAKRRVRREAKRLLFVGQWLGMKGIDYLVEAFSQLAGNNSDLQLWCVGTLLDEQTVLAAFPEKIRPQVMVRPKVGKEELRAIYRESDIFVFPSLSEGSSLALLEAMSAGLPIVTTPVGAAPDMLESEVNALLVSKRDSIALTGALQRVIDDFFLRERLGAQARVVASRYESSHIFHRYMRIVESLMNKDDMPSPLNNLASRS